MEPGTKPEETKPTEGNDTPQAKGSDAPQAKDAEGGGKDVIQSDLASRVIKEMLGEGTPEPEQAKPEPELNPEPESPEPPEDFVVPEIEDADREIPIVYKGKVYKLGELIDAVENPPQTQSNELELIAKNPLGVSLEILDVLHKAGVIKDELYRSLFQLLQEGIQKGLLDRSAYALYLKSIELSKAASQAEQERVRKEAEQKALAELKVIEAGLRRKLTDEEKAGIYSIVERVAKSEGRLLSLIEAYRLYAASSLAARPSKPRATGTAPQPKPRSLGNLSEEELAQLAVRELLG